ncbi:MAG: CIA30 family protein [Elusimicrobiota bacterium]|nr:CIA30 family protein [Endomicrobiia bacterium]MDW8165084.1 CIA30 family protein [Elusimicrobiota bacterium]
MFILMFLFILMFFNIVFGQDIIIEDFNQPLKNWYFVGDQISGGASTCKAEVIKEENENVLKWEYSLQKTDKWEWCYTTVGKSFESPINLLDYQALQFKIKSSNFKEYVLINLVTKDKNLNINKYNQYVIKISTSWELIVIPFRKFKIVGWWKGRNKGFNPEVELDKVVGLEFSKSGISGEKGFIYIDKISFVRQFSKEYHPKKDYVFNKYKITINKSESIKNYSLEAKVFYNEVFNPPYKNTNGKISANLYGTNWGMWLFSFPNEDLVKALNIKVLRAGGNLMSRYNWRTSRYRDTSIGETYVYELPKIDEFVEYSRRIGAEPLIQINMLGYAPNEKNDNFEFCMDEKDAADLVYYLNGIKKYDVTFFEMDNEPCIWHLTHKDVQQKPISISEYFEKLKKFVIAMREAQSKVSKKPLKIFAPAICTSWLDWGTYGDITYNGCEGAVDYLIKKCAEFERNKKENPKGYRLIDVVSFHIYPRFRINWEDPYDFIPQGTEKMLESTRTFWDEEYINYYDYNQVRGIITRVIPRFNEWISRYNPSLELAITEINVDSMGKVNYPNVVRPLFMADIYGISAKYGVDYIMQFCLNDYEGGFGMINESDEENVNYYVFKIFSENFNKGYVLNTTNLSNKNISLYANKFDDKINIIIVNKNNFDIPIKLEIDFSQKNTSLVFDSKRYSISLLKFEKNSIFNKDMLEFEVEELIILPES